MARTIQLRDPIHGDITLEKEADAFLLALIDTSEFQRLRRVRQLALAGLVFHGAEHSRYTHSVGAFALMRRILEHLARTSDDSVRALISAHARVAEVAALLHDLGHGPFSHAFESVCTSQDHEETTRQLLRFPTSEVHQVLQRFRIDPEAVIAMHDGRGPAPFFSQLLSSHLDVDRMDYLLRDAYMTGAHAGNFDLERVIHALVAVPTEDGPTLAVSEKGVLSVEAFLLARSAMFQQVYQHKTTQAAEVLLRAILQRASMLAHEGRLTVDHPALRPVLLENRIDPAHFAELDDATVTGHIQQWQRHGDPALADLSQRFLRRRLFKAIRVHDVPPLALLQQVRALLEGLRYDPDAYVRYLEWTFTPLPAPVHPHEGVRVATERGLVPIEARSEILGALAGKRYEHHLLLVPEEVRGEVARMVSAWVTREAPEA